MYVQHMYAAQHPAHADASMSTVCQHTEPFHQLQKQVLCQISTLMGVLYFDWHPFQAERRVNQQLNLMTCGRNICICYHYSIHSNLHTPLSQPIANPAGLLRITCCSVLTAYPSSINSSHMLLLHQEYEIDFLSLSYTRTVEDVVEARSFLDSIGLTSVKVFAKLESRQALLNFKGILNEADGIIISRGNLGLDCLPEKMALIQKTLIQSCNLVSNHPLHYLHGCQVECCIIDT